MQDKIAQEVQDALTKSPEEITFEQLQNEDSSPLNQPVVEKDIGGERPADDEKQKSWNVWKPEQEQKTVDELEPGRSGNKQTDFRSKVEANVEQERKEEPLDAPEQEINGNGFDTEEEAENDTVTDNDFEVPLAQANQAADALLGMTNNVMAVGGGYFVKINKHKEFYEFDEIIEVIDKQNDKNVERVKLDKEDQALLRPLLAQVLRKKAKKLTPEQQLLGAVVSVLMKKAQVVMEVRAENNLLEERILDIIREEKGYSDQDEVKDDDTEEKNEETVEDVELGEVNTESFDSAQDKLRRSVKAEKETIKQVKQEPTIQDIEAEEVDEDVSILEVAEEQEPEA
ncbi:hypothetical protein [uncultured Winogradskyella sp.]|uniref:hypothetical protein n=1 Tax=uncultured Winogradskyella sp. TaxID=395353 RepID=UPI0030DD1D7B|tara:strand:+ start:4759 stop:5784 length:1026 start_codon:yes stop_codon:yes gene_type:complete